MPGRTSVASCGAKFEAGTRQRKHIHADPTHGITSQLMQSLYDPSNGEWGTRHQTMSSGSRPHHASRPTRITYESAQRSGDGRRTLGTPTQDYGLGPNWSAHRVAWAPRAFGSVCLRVHELDTYRASSTQPSRRTHRRAMNQNARLRIRDVARRPQVGPTRPT